MPYPSSDDLRVIRDFKQEGSGSSGLESKRHVLMLQATIFDGCALDAFMFGKELWTDTLPKI